LFNRHACLLRKTLIINLGKQIYILHITKIIPLNSYSKDVLSGINFLTYNLYIF
jgi:hypothetical protein